MRFRPCIDIHNGAVKQIVGSSLKDEGDRAKENYVAEKDAAWFASYYKNLRLSGGHVILLNKAGSPYYEATKEQALQALSAYPGGLMAGGGITDENGEEFLDAGASHLIVTSYLFRGGKLDEKRLAGLTKAYGRDRLVIDLSCRRLGGEYYVVTDRWQTFTDCKVTLDLLNELSLNCAEFLIHGVDVEGKGAGMEEDLVRLLSGFRKVPVTYAGGIGSLEDLLRLRDLSGGVLDFTIGSALSLFGGILEMKDVLSITDWRINQ